MADPRLSRAQREVVEADYGMEAGALEIRTRGKLVPYVLRLLHIDSSTRTADPTAQQIVVDNREALARWLFA